MDQVMASSPSSIFFFCSFILPLIAQLAIAFGVPRTVLYSENVKVELYKLTLATLSKSYFVNFDPDLTFLKISQSEISEIDSDAFDGFNHLNLLDLSDNEINGKIHPQTFSGIPSLEILILKKNSLTEITLNLTNVQELILSQNKLENLNGKSLVGHNVVYLDISDNKITNLENSMEFLEKLSMIDMSRNKIENVGEFFQNNSHLIRILAAENRLTSTKGLRSPRLKTLDLFANRFQALKTEDFTKMFFLEELVLAFNSIKTIEDPFKDLYELRFLNLAWNFIEDIRPELFRNNLYLSHLSLEGNKLKSVMRFSNTLEHLVELDLSHNELSYIDDTFFESTPHLSVLDLSFNQMKVVTDMFQSLPMLRVLDLASNRIVLSGYEFTKNAVLSRVNLSSNNLEVGLTSFKNNPFISSLDLSNNSISNFCDSDVTLKYLSKLDIKGNFVTNLDCLKSRQFKSLCSVDLRSSGLTCDQRLDDLMRSLAMRRISPFVRTDNFKTDILLKSCGDVTLRESFSLWNAAKREICPKGRDLQLNMGGWERQDESSEASDNSSPESLEELTFNDDSKILDSLEIEAQFLILPFEKLLPASLEGKYRGSVPVQSERESWEKISVKNPEFSNAFEEPEVEISSYYNWYTVALLLLVICFTLTCFNIVVFMYIRLRMCKSYYSDCEQKYSILENEVCKSSSEPMKRNGISMAEDKVRDKINVSYEKINEFFVNFTGGKKVQDLESTKSILIHTTGNGKEFDA